mmetsp:Transcript_19782/g.25120  ORF Transcript_19782/g.25120 Transcript_19782/m.25120 type:complete len:187 (+) Transcript_19782:3-563(+)
MKEDAFFAMIFCLLRQHMYGEEEDQDVSREVGLDLSQPQSLDLDNVNKNNTEYSTKLQMKLEQVQQENTRLVKLLQETQSKLDQTQAQLSSLQQSSSPSLPNNQKPQQQQQPSTSHKGTWKMDSDSIEFLQLDEILKENLRSEKKKRLMEVQTQMKFILDSDDVHDSFGEWDCCGQTDYYAHGCSG